MKNFVKSRFLIILAFLFVLILGGYNFILITSQATDENIFVKDPQGVRITQIFKNGASDRAGLRVGDVITRINGKSFNTLYEADSLLQREYIGKKLEYDVLREGKKFTIDVELASFGIQLFYLVAIIAGLLMGILGLYVGLKRPDLFAARLFTLVCLLALLAAFLFFPPRPSQAPGYFVPLSKVIRGLIMFLLVAVSIHLAFYFPVNKFSLKNTIRKRTTLLYTALIISYLTGLAIGLKIIRPPYLALNSWLNVVWLIFIFFGSALLHTRYKNVSQDYRKKSKFLRYIKLVFLISLVFQFAPQFIPKMDQNFISLGSIFLLFIPILIFITIQRYRVFDLTILIRTNWLYYIFTTLRFLLLTMFFLLIINFLPYLSKYLPVVFIHGANIEIFSMDKLALKSTMAKQAVLVGYGIGFSLIVLKLHGLIKNYLDRKFFRAKYDYRIALRQFSHLGIFATDVESLSKSVVSNLNQVMHLKQLALLVLEKQQYVTKASDGFEFDKPPQIDQSLLKEHFSPHARFIEIDRIPIPQLQQFRKQGAVFLQLIESKDRIPGLLIVGEKKSESAYNKEDIELLKIISYQIAAALENIRLIKEFSHKERLQHELNLARQIQLSSLPAQSPGIAGLDVYAKLLPASEVGGDYYDYFPISPKESAILIGDVSGKGMPAALFMSRIQGIMRSLKHLHSQPQQLLKELNQILYRDLPKNSFFTLSYLLVNLEKRTFQLARAGHNGVLYLKNGNGHIDYLEPSGIGLGLEPGEVFQKKLDVYEQRLNPRDIILLYTDGVTEAMNSRQELYGEEKLTAVLKAQSGKTSNQIIQSVESDLQNFRNGVEQNDDFTLIAVKVI